MKDSEKEKERRGNKNSPKSVITSEQTVCLRRYDSSLAARSACIRVTNGDTQVHECDRLSLAPARAPNVCMYVQVRVRPNGRR